MMRVLPILFVALFSLRPAMAGELTVAVASNFLPVMEDLAAAFERETGDDVVVVHGSTGQIFAQITNGAPFDVFLSADQARPAKLMQNGVASQVRTYAVGRLSLISRKAIKPETAKEALVGLNVALADPILAPYGLAATAAMESLKLDTATFQPLPVANVAQAATLFATGNADAAFVAASLLPDLNPAHQLPLDGLHPPILQDAAWLKRAEGNVTAQAFWTYLFSETARPRIRAGGYALPE